MASKVNLDALIVREDFEVEVSNPMPGTNKSTMSINDLEERNLFFQVLRKPDFQRETSAWDAKKICDFIESFIDGDLIPAIILWRSSSGYSFIVDGSHRVSALAAWINDDYGDGSLSMAFYDGRIPNDQREVAEKTRELIYKRVGTYQEHMNAFRNQDKANSEIVERAKKLATQSIYLQWIPGDSSKAEESFFKINQKAAPIDASEKRVLQARRKPNGIATRAIIRGGKGHKYWSIFSDVNQKKIEKLAKEIQAILFNPELETPIKTLDLPIAGKVYSAQTIPLILDFIEIVNGRSDKMFEDDVDGEETIKYLANCKKIAQIINSDFTGSLGLAPFVYFYSIANGRHKPASFYAVIAFVMELDQKKKFKDFIKVRAKFEKLLIRYDYLIQQIVRRYRSAGASYEAIKSFYIIVIEKLLDKKNEDEVVSEICKLDTFDYLAQVVIEPEFVSGKDFSTEAKSEAFLSEVINSAPTCKICGGYLHRNSISIDHKLRKREGGKGELKNSQLTHPFCNSGIKN